MNGFVQTLALTQMQKASRKWRIDLRLRIDLRFYFAGNRKEHFSHAVRAPDLVSVDSEHARQ